MNWVFNTLWLGWRRQSPGFQCKLRKWFSLFWIFNRIQYSDALPINIAQAVKDIRRLACVFSCPYPWSLSSALSECHFSIWTVSETKIDFRHFRHLSDVKTKRPTRVVFCDVGGCFLPLAIGRTPPYCSKPMTKEISGHGTLGDCNMKFMMCEVNFKL